MTALMFLALAGAICLLGFGVLYLRSRQPNTLESGIDDFRREMDALSPQDAARRAPRRPPGPTQPRRGAGS